MRAFGDDYFAIPFSSGSSAPEFEVEDPFPHESQVPTSLVNQAQTSAMRSIPDSGNRCSMNISLDDAEICWVFDDAPEIVIDVITGNDSSRCRQLSGDAPRLSMTEVEPQKVRRRQPKQIVFPVSSTKRYRICPIVRAC